MFVLFVYLLFFLGKRSEVFCGWSMGGFEVCRSVIGKSLVVVMVIFDWVVVDWNVYWVVVGWWEKRFGW